MNLKSCIPVFVAGAMVITFVSMARGAVAVTLNSPNNASWATAASIGFEFTVNTNMYVTDLGYLGTTDTHDVGIYDAGTQILLTSTTVPSGTAASGDGFSYVSITPYLLLAGNTYVLAGSETTSADPYIYDAVPPPTYNPAISFIEERYVINAGVLQYPDLTVADRHGYFGPNFQFQEAGAAVPETSTLLIWSLLGIVVGVKGLHKRLNRKSPA